MCCRSDFNSVLARFQCWLLKGRLKWDFLDIYLTTFFGVGNLTNTSAMTVISFLKMFKIEFIFRKCKKKKKKKMEHIFFHSGIYGSENVAINCLY